MNSVTKNVCIINIGILWGVMLMNTANENNTFQLFCDRHFLFEILIVVAGMMGAYTYLLRGEVFCNAQTLNVVMLAINIGQGNIMSALYFIIPISAYLGGAICTMWFLPDLEKKFGLHSERFVIGLEIILLFVVGLVPKSVPDQVAQVMVNFIASMQFSAFRKSEHLGMSTTFATNHIRQIGTWFVDYVKNGNHQAKRNCLKHLRMLACFMLGVILLTVMVPFLSVKSIWLTVIPLGLALSVTICGDAQEGNHLIDLNSNPADDRN